MAQLAITLMGRFAVAVDGQPVAVGGQKQQALLAYLAYNAGAPGGREELVGLLWGDRFDDQARHSLRQALMRLRRALEKAGVSPLEADTDSISFKTAEARVDILEFRELAGKGDPDSLESAGTLYGELLQGFVVRQEGFDGTVGGHRSAERGGGPPGHALPPRQWR
jgi:DNA-binding SARP family transcriptional activator